MSPRAQIFHRCLSAEWQSQQFCHMLAPHLVLAGSQKLQDAVNTELSQYDVLCFFVCLFLGVTEIYWWTGIKKQKQSKWKIMCGASKFSCIRFLERWSSVRLCPFFCLYKVNVFAAEALKHVLPVWGRLLSRHFGAGLPELPLCLHVGSRCRLIWTALLY